MVLTTFIYFFTVCIIIVYFTIKILRTIFFMCQIGYYIKNNILLFQNIIKKENVSLNKPSINVPTTQKIHQHKSNTSITSILKHLE